MGKIFIWYDICSKRHFMRRLSSRGRRYLIEVLPGAIISLPISLYLASAEVKYHPYWRSFIVSYLGFYELQKVTVK